MTRAGIVAAARGWVGTPYHHQASARGAGCDCLGLVRGVWREVVGEEPEMAPPYSPDWAEATGGETLLDAARRHFVQVEAVKAGSVVVFRWRMGMPAKHVGIAAAPGRLIHAYDSVGRVVETTFSDAWRRRIAAVFDFPGVTD